MQPMRTQSSCRYRGGAQLPEELLNGYRLPQLLKGWESGLLRFLTCRISGKFALPCTAGGHL